MPDFVLRILPSSLMLHPGGSATFSVQVIPHDGFVGSVSFSLAQSPPGIRLSGGPLPSGSTTASLTLHAALNTSLGVMPLQLVGQSQVGGRTVVHPAVPADDMMQAFAYHHLVPSQQWAVVVIPRPGPRGP